VLKLRDGPYLEFPSCVSIETLSLCNAACNFCPYPKLTRRGQSMTDRLIEKIFRDIEAIPNRPAFEFNLSTVNEPFLDPRVLDISDEIKRRFPEATHAFFSNGSLLTETTLLRLGALKRVYYLILSVNDHRPSEYERTMRLPFARTIARLDLMHEMKKAGLLGFGIDLCRVGDQTAADAEFLEWVKAKYPLFNGIVTVRHDWMGATPPPPGYVPDVPCRQWFQVHVLPDGSSPFCCIDSDARNGFGNAETHHVIHELYNHPLKKKLRSQIPSRLSLDQCRQCTMLP
jgi:hypothetical protein